MTDKFNIVVDGDITPFERKISQIENRIKRMREFGPSGTYSQLSEQYKEAGNTQKAQRMEEYRQRAGNNNRRQMARDLKAQEDLLKKNESAQQRITNSLNNTLKTQENLNKAKQLQNQLEEKHISLVGTISKMKQNLSDRGPGMGPFSGREMDFMKRGMGGGRGVMGGIAAAGRTIMRNPRAMASAAGLVGTAIQTGGEFAKTVMTYPERIAQREATTAGMLSETARLQEGRRGYEMSFYGPERRKAMDRARTRVSAEKISDGTSLIGGTLAAAGAGGLVGSAIPGVGTAIGAIGAGAAYFGKQMFNDRKRSMVTDAVGLTENNYGKEMDAVFADKYKEQLEVEKAKSYEKTMAAGFFNKNSKRFRGLQRGMGLSDKDLFEGGESIFQRAGRGGYNMDTMTQNMQGILAGGGRASVAAAGGQVTAQMQRNMDLSNAPQLMGKISGATGGGVGESKDAIIRMYAEATRLGLDASEVRGFLQTSADMANQSGASTDVVSALLGSGIGGLKTGRGIKASATALESIKRQTGEMGGLTGQYQLAEFADVKVGGADGKQRGLTMGEQAYLGGTDVSKLDADSDFIKGLMPGKSKEERQAFVKELRKKKSRASLRSDEQDKALGKLNTAESALEKAKASGDQGAIEDAEKDVLAAKKDAKSSFALANDGFTKMGIKEQDAELNIRRKLKSGEYSAADAAEARKKYQTDRGRLTDEEEKAQGKDDVGQLQRLSKPENILALATAFQETTEKTVLLGEAMDALAKSVDKSKGTSDEALREQFMKVMKSINGQAPTNTGDVDTRNAAKVDP
tara:strand:- start:16450 stop:18855 length:2406 start_codon:yes stop_codon:yes gene_type:complete